jgi:hypothetical protein
MRFLLVLSLLAWSGCAKLPESVPMTASVKLEGGPNAMYPDQVKAVSERFVGAEVVSNGKVLTKLELNGLMLEGKFTLPRAEAIGSQKAPYTLRVRGTCGAHELQMSPPNALWQGMPEKELARVLKEGGDVPIYLGVPSAAVVTVFLDAGDAPAGKVTLGETEIAPSKQGVETGQLLSLSGCKLPVDVKLDGETIGQLDGKAPAVLISTQAGQCHEVGAVLYGDQKEPPFPRFVTRGRGVFALPRAPEHFLEFAPTTVQSASKGTWVTQLVRVNCE